MGGGVGRSPGRTRPESNSLDGLADRVASRTNQPHEFWDRFWSQGASRIAGFDHFSEPPSRYVSERLLQSKVGPRAIELRGLTNALAEIGFAAAQSLLDSSQLDEAIKQDTGQQPHPDSRRMIVYHGQDGARRSVLILDPELPSSARARAIAPEKYETLLANPSPSAGGRAALLYPDLIRGPDELVEAILIARPMVIVAPAAPMSKTSVPRQPWRVGSGAEHSTAGAIARDAAGQLGVTPICSWCSRRWKGGGL
jgi:hypothetical protein